MAYPGSPFFKGDSIRYLQVISAHGLIMVFFVVVPLLFGTFANFLIPYHIGSRDVAFPRLNSIGFWIQPLGFVIIAKVAFLRPQYWHYYDKTAFTTPLIAAPEEAATSGWAALFSGVGSRTWANPGAASGLLWRARKACKAEGFGAAMFNPLKTSLWELCSGVSNGF